MGILQGIDLERAIGGADCPEICLPFRMQALRWFEGHPGGKAFIEPQVVPPFHGHQIAKPLMGHLVGQHFEDRLAPIHRGVFLVQEQQRFAVENGAGILHGPSLKIRHAHNVQFLEGILDAVILVVKLEDLLGIVNGHNTQRLFVRRAADADRNLIR